MNKNLLNIIFIFICSCLVPRAGLPCTTFVLENDGRALYGKNMDYAPMAAYVLVNKRGVAKTTIPNDANPAATWTSKYGSITFNWLARELPFEGINEAGLFVSAMGGGDVSELPEPDSRPLMSVDQWIQYQLDNFSTVDEVIASDKDVRIEMPVLHFLVSDSNGNSAIIEFLKGIQVYHTGETMPVNVLTNTIYDESLEVLSHFQGFGGFLPVPRGDFLKYYSSKTNSFLRFVRTADMLHKYDPQTSDPAVDYAFKILQDVEMYPIIKSAVWSTVYDPFNKTIYLRSSGNDRIRRIEISAFDFSCTTPVKALDVQAELEGDVTESFVDYTEDMSREMLESAAQYFPLSDEFIDLWATYPEKYTSCTE